MPSELVQRLRNLHQFTGDPDTVDEAAATLESLEGVCSSHLANIKRLSEYIDSAKQHIERIERLCREQAAEIAELTKDRASLVREADILREMVVERDAQLAEAVKVHMEFVQEADEIKFKNAVDRAGLVKLTDEQAQRVLNAIREAGL